jgi:hypothetical protein
MAIRIQPENLSGLYAKAAKIIGQSQAAQREIERAEKIQDQLRSIAASKEMAQFNQQLALDRAKFDAMMDVEAEKRAKAWQIEKMEMASRIDFAEAEKKRLQSNQQYDLAIKQLNENPIYARLTPEEKDNAKQILEMRKYTTATSEMFPQERQRVPSSYEQWELYKELGLMPQEMYSPEETVQPTTPSAIPEPKSEAEYNSLPKGTTYRYLDGSIRTKQ